MCVLSVHAPVLTDAKKFENKPENYTININAMNLRMK